MGAQLCVQKLYQNYDDVFFDSEVEAVSIHTPDEQHKDPFLKALTSRKHILIEKPLANTVEDVFAMVNAAEAVTPSLKIQVGYILRFNPVFEMIQKMARAHKLGHIYYLEADYIHNLTKLKTSTDPVTGENWYLQEQIPIVSGGSHCVDLLRWIKGMNPTHVFSYGNHFAFPDLSSNDCVVSIFRFKDGAVAKVSVLWAPECPRPPFYNLGLFGTKGTIKQDRFYLRDKGSRGDWKFTPVKAARIEGHPFDPEIDDWLTAIIEDRDVRVCLKDGANSTMSALIAAKAINSDREATIPIFE